MEEPKITLDSSAFKALASQTRVKILKVLHKRNHTQSELSAVLKMSIPTIKDHLKAMEQAGLVKRKEEGRKWIYYSLTEKAKCVLDPERKRLWIVLSFFVLSIIGTVITIARYFGQKTTGAVQAEKTLMAARAPEAMDTALQTTSIAPEPVNYFFYVMVFFIGLSVLLLIIALFYLKKTRILKK